MCVCGVGTSQAWGDLSVRAGRVARELRAGVGNRGERAPHFNIHSVPCACRAMPQWVVDGRWGVVSGLKCAVITRLKSFTP